MRLLAILPALAAVAVLATAPPPAPAAPAGGKIAFWRKCGTGCGDLYLTSTAGAVRRLTRTDAAFSPSWSPDGKRLVYAADPGGRAGAYELYVLDLASGRSTRLTRTPRTVVSFAPAWSPDGRSIAFVRARFNRVNSHALYVLDLRSGAARRVAAGANPDSAPAWSPDSRLLAFSADERLELVKPNGKGRRTLAVGADPDWAPDGREVAYSDGSAVFAIDVGSGKRRTIARGGGDPSWSSDGRIVFTVQLPIGSTGLDIVRGDGTGRRQLTRPGDLRHDQGPAWRP